MSQFNIEELRSQENHADTNFTELQELRKIHQLTLQRIDILEKIVSNYEQSIIALCNERRKITEQLGCAISHINEALADATQCEQAIDGIKRQVDKDPGC